MLYEHLLYCKSAVLDDVILVDNMLVERTVLLFFVGFSHLNVETQALNISIYRYVYICITEETIS